MVKCLCRSCKNRAVGCNKFCADYRKYRRKLEEWQSLIEQGKSWKNGSRLLKSGKRAEKVNFKSVFKENFKRK